MKGRRREKRRREGEKGDKMKEVIGGRRKEGEEE